MISTSCQVCSDSVRPYDLSVNTLRHKSQRQPAAFPDLYCKASIPADPTYARSQRIAETNKALNRLPSRLSTSIRPLELQHHSQCDDNNERRRNHARPDTRLVGRLVLLAEHGAADDSTDTAEADEGGGAQGALPLAADVVCLPGQDAGDISVAGGGGQEDAKVADADVLDVAEETET